MVNFFTLLGASVFVSFLLMTALWVVYYFKKNAGIIDLGWAAGFIILAWIFVLLGDGYFFKKIILALLITIWSGRLLGHLYKRFMQTQEDPRYVEIRNNFRGNNTDVKIYGMYLLQAFLLVVLSIPFIILNTNAQPGWQFEETFGIILWAIGVLGEAFADYQLMIFKQNPENANKVCRQGLWRFSRHPNYFFEWVTWIGFFFFILPTPWGFFALIGPAVMLLLLLKISGIPLAEAQAIKSKGTEYEKYQKTTSAFLPWFPENE